MLFINIETVASESHGIKARYIKVLSVIFLWNIISSAINDQMSLYAEQKIYSIENLPLKFLYRQSH